MFRLIKGLFVINQFELILFKGCPILIFGPPFYLISIFKKRGVYDVVFWLYYTVNCNNDTAYLSVLNVEEKSHVLFLFS